jgi:hypothetical protein
LVTATINDSIMVDRKGINWLKNPVCVELKVDTVDEGLISKFKGEDRFYYKGNVYYKNQLFDLKYFNRANEIKISKIVMSCTNLKFYVAYTTSEGACFSDKLKETLLEHHKTAIRIKQTLNLYFDVYIKNSNDKDILFCTLRINLIPEINSN